MMIVQRVFHQVKPGRLGEFLALMKGQPESVLNSAKVRTYYTASIGPSAHTVCHELEFEDLAELHRVWTAWWAAPGTPAYMEKHWDSVEGRHNEVWELAE